MRFYVEACAGEFAQGLRCLLEERGHELIGRENCGGENCETEKCGVKGSSSAGCDSGVITIRYQAGREDELRVSLNNGLLEITSGVRVHFFRGFMKTLMYLEERGSSGCEYAFREHAWFRSAGAMLDCSRNGVLKPEKVMEYIRRMASLGMNSLMLYTEETYEVAGRPYFGAFRGRFTQEELRCIDDYAAIFGVEVVPCIQTLAHLHTALRWKEMAGFRDTEDILLAGDEEVYRLIDDMIGAMSASFRSRRIHLGMDEAHELGLGRYLKINGYQNRFEIMTRHLERVADICKKYGLEPMIWSDMYFRLKSATGDYYDLSPDTDFSDIPKPPKEVTMVYWDYYHDEKTHYNNYFELHKRLSEKMIYAGGAWIWNGVAPNYSCMAATLRAGLEACRESGVKETVCTFWQDNGAETPMEAGNMPLVLFAEGGFSEEDGSGQEEEADRFLKFLWGDGLEAWWLLDQFDRTPGVRGSNLDADNPSKFLLYQDLMMGLFDGQIDGLLLSSHYGALAEKLASYRHENPKASGIFQYYEVLARLLEGKAELGIRICRGYRDGDAGFLKHAADSVIPGCMEQVRELSALRRELWMGECRIFGFEVLDIRLAGVEARLKNAQMRIRQYLSGETDRLPELEEARLVYSPDHENRGHVLCSCNSWQNIVSAGNIAGI